MINLSKTLATYDRLKAEGEPFYPSDVLMCASDTLIAAMPAVA